MSSADGGGRQPAVARKRVGGHERCLRTGTLAHHGWLTPAALDCNAGPRSASQPALPSALQLSVQHGSSEFRWLLALVRCTAYGAGGGLADPEAAGLEPGYAAITMNAHPVRRTDKNQQGG
jgi:hypothetical protein